MWLSPFKAHKDNIFGFDVTYHIRSIKRQHMMIGMCGKYRTTSIMLDILHAKRVNSNAVCSLMRLYKYRSSTSQSH